VYDKKLIALFVVFCYEFFAYFLFGFIRQTMLLLESFYVHVKTEF